MKNRTRQTTRPIRSYSASGHPPLLNRFPDTCIFLLSSLGCTSILTYFQTTLFDLPAAKYPILSALAFLVGTGISYLLFVLRKAQELSDE